MEKNVDDDVITNVVAFTHTKTNTDVIKPLGDFLTIVTVFSSSGGPDKKCFSDCTWPSGRSLFTPALNPSNHVIAYTATFT